MISRTWLFHSFIERTLRFRDKRTSSSTQCRFCSSASMHLITITGEHCFTIGRLVNARISTGWYGISLVLPMSSHAECIRADTSATRELQSDVGADVGGCRRKGAVTLARKDARGEHHCRYVGVGNANQRNCLALGTSLKCIL